MVSCVHTYLGSKDPVFGELTQVFWFGRLTSLSRLKVMVWLREEVSVMGHPLEKHTPLFKYGLVLKGICALKYLNDLLTLHK